MFLEGVWGGLPPPLLNTIKMENLLTVGQIANKLGVKCPTIYQWAHMGFIPYVRMGKCLRFDEKEVEKWLEKRKTRGRIRYKIRV